MNKYEFHESEISKDKTRFMYGCELSELDTPITPKENMIMAMNEKKAVWLPSTFDIGYLFPKCVPDNPAKGNVSDCKLPADQLGGFDMFGIEWEYVADIGGSTVRPGNPLLSDANEWYEKVKFPTKEVIDSWDWAEAKEVNEKLLRDKDLWEIVICTGYYERLISFMDFEEAAVAMIDEEQQDAVKDLFDKLSDLYIMLIDKYIEVFGDKIGAVCLHDDWGHQRGIFFSPDTVREMVVPAMKKVTDYCHKLGLHTECHSCGKVDPLLPVYIEAGFEMLECQPLLDFAADVPKYGDKLIMHYPPANAPKDINAPEEEHIQKAREFVDTCLSFGYPIMMDNYYAPLLSKTYTDEVYRYSRERYYEMNK